MEVKFTVNKGNAFWDLISVRLIEGDRLIKGSLRSMAVLVGRAK